MDFLNFLNSLNPVIFFLAACFLNVAILLLIFLALYKANARNRAIRKAYTPEEVMRRFQSPSDAATLFDLPSSNVHFRDSRLIQELADRLVSFGQLALEPALAALNHKDREVRFLAATVLVRLGEPRVLEAIPDLLRGGRRHNIAQMLRLLEGSGDTRAIHPVIAFTRNLRDDHYMEIRKFLVSFGQASVTPIIEAINDDADYPDSVFHALEWIEDPRAVGPLLERFIRLRDDRVLSPLVKLGLDDPRSIPYLKDALRRLSDETFFFSESHTQDFDRLKKCKCAITLLRRLGDTDGLDEQLRKVQIADEDETRFLRAYV